MPHHSAHQKRQMSGGASYPGGSSNSSVGGVGHPPPPPPPPPLMTAASMSFPPRSAYGDYHRLPGAHGVAGGPQPPPYGAGYPHHQQFPQLHHHQQSPGASQHLLMHQQHHPQQQHPPVSMASSWASTSSPSGSSVHNGGIGGVHPAAGANGTSPGSGGARVDLRHSHPHEEMLRQPHLLHPNAPNNYKAQVSGVYPGASSSRSTGGGASVVDEDAMSTASTHGGGGNSTASGVGTGTNGSPGGSGAGTPRLMVLPNDDGRSRSFDSTTPHEVAAASVLLLAATAMKECGAAAAAAAAGGASNAHGRSAIANDDNEEEEGRDEPEPKKRKHAGAAGIMRKKSNDASQASHVSPYSQSSASDADSPKSAHTNATNAGAATTTPVQDRRHHTGAGTSPSSSYDLKDGQALHDSAKINDPKDIAAQLPAHSPTPMVPPSHVEIPHFPSVLHAVLTESEFAGKVLLWLPHGQAWRIVRWDALRRQVLPKYFAQLNEDGLKDAASSSSAAATASSSPSGSIDAFLWHLSAWGFEEVNDGPDAGAYSHVLFRRELPGLCREMRFAPTSNVTTPTHEPDKDHRSSSSGDVGGGVRYILQVPSLASSTGGPPSSNAGDDDRKDDRGTGPNGRRASYPNQVTPAWPTRPHVTLGYHPHSYGDPHPAAAGAPGSGGGPWKFYPEQPSQWVGSSGSNHAIDTSSPNSASSQRSVPPYSPIRVRSGRGACRLPLSRPRADPDADTAAPRSSFPVSNRGKGGKAAIRRVSHPCPSEASLSGGGLGNGFAIGGATSGAVLSPNSLADDATDNMESSKPRMSILKRKLPLMRKSTSSPAPFSAAAEGDDDVQGDGLARVTTPTNDHPADQRAGKALSSPPSGEKQEEEKKEDEEGDGARSRGGLAPSSSFLREGGSTSPVATHVTPV